MPQRKLARVLPEPVGAQIRVLAPLEIASQPPAWAGVGPSKEASNQRRTGSLKGASGSDSALCFASVLNPPILRPAIRRDRYLCPMPVWRAFSRLIAGSGRLAGWSLALSVAQSLALIPIALLVRRAFDDAIPANDSGELLWIGAAIGGLYLLSLGLGLIGRYVVLNITKPAVARVQSELIAHVITLPRSYFDGIEAGRLHSLIVQDTERLDTMAKYLLAIVIPSLGTAGILIACLAVIQPLLFIVLAVTVPLLILVGRLLRGVLKNRVRAWQEASDAFSSVTLETLRSMTLIKLRTAEGEATEAATRRAEELGAAGQRIGWVQQAYGLAQVGLGGIAGVVVLVGGGIAVADGTMTLGDLIAFMAILAMAQGAAQLGRGGDARNPHRAGRDRAHRRGPRDRRARAVHGNRPDRGEGRDRLGRRHLRLLAL